MEKIRFKDLSGWLKIAAIISWITLAQLVILGASFLIVLITPNNA
jgi:hypothetical protein